jgi:glycosyltransferase involved in cell wall biosynthesis
VESKKTSIMTATLLATSKVKLKPIDLSTLPEEPLVSILVANYNYEKFIGQTIESVLKQKYQNFELVICDDGSTDNSLQIIEQYLKKDPRVRLIQKQNGGHGPALNAAYAVSRGEVICLLDSDDLFLPEKLGLTVESFKLNPEAGFGIHRVIRVNEHRRRQGVFPMSSSLPHGWHGSELLSDGGILSYLPPTSALSLRREVADRLFPLPTHVPVRFCPDQVIMRLAPLVTPIARTDKALTEYRLHNSNSYSRLNTTRESLSRDIEICEQIWKVQKEFLLKLKPEIAESLKPAGSSTHFRMIKYLHARLSDDPAVAKRHPEYLADLCRKPYPKHMWFWRTSRYLPRPVFAAAADLLIRQSALKQFLARIMRLA